MEGGQVVSEQFSGRVTIVDGSHREVFAFDSTSAVLDLGAQATKVTCASEATTARRRSTLMVAGSSSTSRTPPTLLSCGSMPVTHCSTSGPVWMARVPGPTCGSSGRTVRQRITAVDAAGRLGGPDAEDAVLELSGDESPDVRRFAAYALSRLGTQTARIRLGEMAADDAEPTVRAAAVSSLDREQLRRPSRLTRPPVKWARAGTVREEP